MEDLAVEEQQGVERLILSRGTDAPLNCQVAEEELDLLFGSAVELLALLHVVEFDVSADPLAVTALGADGVMLETQDLPDLVHELKLGVGDDCLPPETGRRREVRFF